MKRWAHSYVFGIAAAIVIGYALMHLHIGAAPTLAKAIILAMISAGVAALAWKLYYRPKPFTETRRYARAMFASGLISMEELQEFYDKHPEAEDGSGR